MFIENEINKFIKNLGRINIQDFVEISNFNEINGFYNKIENEKIGMNGHFITSPEVSSIFSFAMFNQFLDLNQNTKKVHLLELGPGNGLLTSDILNEMNNNNIEVISTTFLEKSSYFRAKLDKKFKNLKNFKMISNIQDYTNYDDNIVFIYSNEFLDAFGHRQYIYKEKTFNELFITKINNQYKLIQVPSFQSNFLKEEYDISNFKDNDILEHSLLIDFFVQTLNKMVSKFCFITNDYGYDKLLKKNTMRIIKKHKKINLFEDFEEVDYSFSVDFCRLKKLFSNTDSSINTQRDFIREYASKFVNNKQSKSVENIINLFSGTKDNEMGLVFKNFYANK